MTIETWLRSATAKLDQASVATARLDCLVLLEDVLDTNRTQILAHSDMKITGVNQHRLDAMVAKRVRHIPLAYIRGKTEFYGREFIISSTVLEPRPESETMIDMLKAASLPKGAHLADIGSGSGALGITAALEIPGSNLTFIEIDSAALTITERNARLHKVHAQYVLSDLLAETNEQFDVLLCNLPYVPDSYQINTAALHEPRLAIFGGEDGLDLYRRLFYEASARTEAPQYIFCESLPFQHEAVQTIAHAKGYRQTTEQDFIQRFERKI